jgi:DNA-binding transcriptional LysR family regulator
MLNFLDPSVISRRLKNLALDHQVLEKRSGKWEINQRSESLVEWARDAIYSQKLALNRQKSLKIATTREFASRKLIPHVRELVGEDDITISFMTSDEGIEHLITSGQADFGFDCGRPRDPSISFKRVVNEQFVTIANPTFIKKFKIKTFDDLNELDRLRFARTENSILDLQVESATYFGTFSDISSLREACILGYGWAILPYYTVEREIKNKLLKVIKGQSIQNERYGVWWLRERSSLQPWIKRATSWLSKQKL